MTVSLKIRNQTDVKDSEEFVVQTWNRNNLQDFSFKTAPVSDALEICHIVVIWGQMWSTKALTKFILSCQL